MNKITAKFVNIFSIRTTLLIAVSTLVIATILIGSIAYYWLNQTNKSLEELHKNTLNDIFHSINIVRYSSDLIVSVPHLLDFKSSYLIEKEGQLLIEKIEKIGIDAKAAANDNILHDLDKAAIKVNAALDDLRQSIKNLIFMAQTLSQIDDRLNDININLRKLEVELLTKSSQMISPNLKIERQILHSLFNILYAAKRAKSLLSLGEYHRKYVLLSREAKSSNPNANLTQQIEQIDQLLFDKSGLFATRYEEVIKKLDTQNVLLEIKANSNQLNNQIALYTQFSESKITNLRNKTTGFINYAQIIIVAIVLACLILAIITSLYISTYIAKNINSISSAMIDLAKSNQTTQIPMHINKEDEIGKLFQAYKIFGNNAIRLRRLNTQMKQKTALFESMFNNISDGIAITDQANKITNWNPILEMLIHNKTIELSPGTDIIEFIRQSPFGKPFKFEQNSNVKTQYFELKNSSENILEIRVSQLPNGNRIWLFSDVTERKKIEERLFQFQRLESLGLLTGEVVHDFNNILTTVETNIYLLDSTHLNDKQTRVISRIKDALELGSSLTQRLLAFAKKQHLVPEPIELVELISSVIELIQFSLSDDVTLNLETVDQKIWVEIDPGQMENALLNLCLNADHAINGKGSITIKVKLKQADIVIIEVVDTGCGMAQNVIDHAFEPFFSTKSTQEGSGLGLSIVFGFITQSGGKIGIDSKLNQGTKIKLCLPLISEHQSPSLGRSAKHKQRVILNVEDDKHILQATHDILEKNGHKVTSLANFWQAEQILNQPNDFDMLLTDVHLEDDKIGWNLAKLFLDKLPTGKVIVTSGNERESNNILLDQYKNISFIAKPYIEAQLMQQVTKSL